MKPNLAFWGNIFTLILPYIKATVQITSGREIKKKSQNIPAPPPYPIQLGMHITGGFNVCQCVLYQ